MMKQTYTDSSVLSLDDHLDDDDDDYDADYEQAPTDGQPRKGADDDAAVVQNKSDSLRVWISMVVVLGMIALTAAVVMFLAHSMLTSEQQREFVSSFEQQAKGISEATRFHAKTVVGSLEAMSDTITSYTGATDTTWPYVRIPDFDRRGQRARIEAYIETIAFSPLVVYEDRQRWSIYSAYEMEGSLPSLTNNNSISSASSASIGSEIYYIDEETGQAVADDQIFMIPMWQTSPLPYDISVVNLNLLSDSLYYYLFNAMTESMHTALSAVYNNVAFYDKLYAPEEHADMHMNLENTTAKAIELPHSILMSPVYDSFDENRSLAGVIHGILPWDSYLTELLPPGINGIIAVLKNSCGQSFTFRIDGPDAFFLGNGDLHDSKYDQVAHEIPFGQDFLGEETKTYRQCFYSLLVYPSQEFEDTYASNHMESVMILLAIVFAGLAVFFFVFVWFVQRRQLRVMEIAIRTTAIISNLFPANVRDRILAQAKEMANKEYDGWTGANNGDGGGDTSGRGSTLRTLLKDNENGHRNTGMMDASTRLPAAYEADGDINVLSTAPIADLYPNCSVFFGDIAGFTSWSSSREPAEVFVLLETLYGTFDEIARRRRVFKIETIGDCYVAVTGLPKPQSNHALHLARFAVDCMAQGNQVFSGLNSRLGPGTQDLRMRIGLHSGPVTAGVLRGEKGRFQLFGDTVNTASRMESNGEAGRIHLSESAATLLKRAGKASWLTLREDKITAKGKGLMTTYWLNPKGSDLSSNHSLSSETDEPATFAGSTAATVSEGGSESEQDPELEAIIWV